MKIEPIKKAPVSKYAAALAAAAAAVMLTGCDTAGEVATAGEIAVEESVEIVNPDSISAAPDESEPEEVMLDGDVVFVPDFSESAEVVAARSDDQTGIYSDAFAAAGVQLERDPESFSYCDYSFSETLLSQEKNLRVIFYSGIAADHGMTMEEWVQGICVDHRDWGEICTAGETKLVFIDISRESENVPDHAAQIVRDVTA
ncbi:MAG: hypothetical protein MJ065_09310 [Oscillospiraceae bacterium]|nr:hypothetical protein [Oscillospiraceae bacterium]